MEKVRFLPKNIPYLEARHLSEDEQAEYEKAVKMFKDEKAQNNLRVPINSSNIFKVLLLNQIGIRTATLPELDQIIQVDEGFLGGTYGESPSVVLRSNGDSHLANDHLARELANLVRKREFKIPLVISGLKLVEDNNSGYGLGFKEGRNFSFFGAPELTNSNNQRRFTRQDERGMPIFDDNGKRILCTRNHGLSELAIYGLQMNSDWCTLGRSDGKGRVVVVSAGNTILQKQAGENKN